ncbi:T9SS type A sorting domain-containing protein [Adhaeribacter soli]|uniref:T9SS type A sorting domain-containing protein n=1 Tax=Adhaeribacter soli TaxID=2607655 RepID=A0A5N1IN69_9BACT|nr:T9SS type A sorting domain-containing protein [Adhaeribacter soli]KAA9331178.1 T9SS type A sorting domain-containing protein [Adhaeribacter soli]
MKIFTRIILFSFIFSSMHLLGFAAITTNGKAGGPVQAEKSLATLNAYPNPSRGEVVFTLSQSTSEGYKIRISNAIGRTIKTIDVKDLGSSQQIEANLTELPNGLYFYSLLANDKMIETKRLILQR